MGKYQLLDSKSQLALSAAMSLLNTAVSIIKASLNGVGISVKKKHGFVSFLLFFCIFLRAILLTMCKKKEPASLNTQSHPRLILEKKGYLYPQPSEVAS